MSSLFQDWQPPNTRSLAPRAGEFSYVLTIPDPEGTIEEKKAFAEALLRNPDDAMGAAISVFGGQRGSHCYHVSTTWPLRDDVQKIARELLDYHGAEYFLPTKAEVARAVFGIAKDKYTTRDLSLKAYDQYAGLMDMNPKRESGGGKVGVQVGVMLVPAHGNSEDWEAALKVQQEKLMIDATPKSSK